MTDVPAADVYLSDVMGLLRSLPESEGRRRFGAEIIAASQELVHYPGLVTVHQAPSGFASASVNWDQVPAALAALKPGPDRWLLALAYHLESGKTMPWFDFVDIAWLHRGAVEDVLRVLCDIVGYRFP